MSGVEDSPWNIPVHINASFYLGFAQKEIAKNWKCRWNPTGKYWYKSFQVTNETKDDVINEINKMAKCIRSLKSGFVKLVGSTDVFTTDDKKKLDHDVIY
jgi:hypothetical protein